MKEKRNFSLRIILILSVISIVSITLFYIYCFLSVLNKSKGDYSIHELEKSYHILVMGNNENELFLKQVYEGANYYSDTYNAVIELYVPESHAEDISTQSLFEYASFVNADGVIAYINNSDETIESVHRIDDTTIPIVTIGQFAANTNQISFVGTSYWELGRVFGTEILNLTKNNGTVLIQNPTNISTINYSNLTNSILSTIKDYENFTYTISNNIDESVINETQSENILMVGLTEEDTIKLAQLYNELRTVKNISIIGFGNNETCQMYLSKGTLKELISLDPKKVGEAAIRELFEYKNNGYANSYVVSEVTINRGQN